MANKKITKRDRFNELLALAEVKANADLKAFVEHELELLAKKNSADKKPTAQQEANEAIKADILAVMSAEPNRLFTITELLKAVPSCADLTNQKVSAVVRQMVPPQGDQIVRTEKKGRAYFSLPNEGEE